MSDLFSSGSSFFIGCFLHGREVNDCVDFLIRLVTRFDLDFEDGDSFEAVCTFAVSRISVLIAFGSILYADSAVLGAALCFSADSAAARERVVGAIVTCCLPGTCE
jgi:hypothetical protein